jgi:hypothetical protein
MQGKKPVPKPIKRVGCEVCTYRGSDFEVDETEPEVTRMYCKARFFKVHVESMSKGCDFYQFDPDCAAPKEDNNRYGL